jgi:Rps23 Pro-64 3,4-dihydroxylase Tpa1-like proline 4-hydroxylase
MKFTVVKDPIPFLIIDDTYNKEEQTQIYQELDFLVDKLQEPGKTGSALIDGKEKNNKGLFLNDVFSDINFSNIVKTNRKIFNKEIREKLFECHYAYRLFNNTNQDNTLISYYDNGGSYFSHYDDTVITVITWFFKTPKNFIGGEFKFTDFNLDIEVKNNRSVIFFSSYMHEVSEVSILDLSVPASGRFTVTDFLYIKPKY